MSGTNESANKLLENLYEFLQNCQLPIQNSANLRFHLLRGPEKQTTTGKSNTKVNKNFTLRTFILRVTENDREKTTSVMENIRNSKEKIVRLYSKHNLKTPDKQKSAEELLEELLYQCLANEGTHFSLCYSKRLPIDKTFETTSEKYIAERDAAVTDLEIKLKKKGKVLLYGAFGSGKSHFIKYYLKKRNKKNFCYIDYDYTLNSDDSIADIKTTLHKIEYSNPDNTTTYYGSYHELESEAFASSLLVIDSMYFVHDLDRVLEWLSKLSPQIIVITSPPVKTMDFKWFSHCPLPCLSDEYLLEIYEKASGVGKSDSVFSIQSNKCLQEQLLKVSDRNVLMTFLIGRLCSKLSSCKSATDYSLKIVLDYFESLDNRFKKDKNILSKYKYKHSDPKHNNPKDNGETLNIISHIANVYNLLLDNTNSADNTELHTYMKWLSCFGCSPMPLSFISCILPNYKQSNLKELQKLGLIALTDETVQLSPLISEVAFATERPYAIFTENTSPSDEYRHEFQSLFDNLIHFLKSYDNTFSVPYLSNSLYVFASSLYQKVPEKHNPHQKTTSKEYEKWQHLLYLIQYYYNQNGDSLIAQKVISTIRYPELKNAHNPIEQSFFQCGNNMQIASFIEELPGQLDELICLTKNIPDPVEPFETSLLRINAMDTIIGFYCTNSFELILNTDNPNKMLELQIKRYGLAQSLQHLVDSLTFLPNFVEDFLTNEKIHYYQVCSCLMSTNYPSLGSFEFFHSYLKERENANNRIRGIAFILFMQSLDYRFPDNSIYNYYSLPAVFQILMEKADFLRIQIQNCTFIPTQTFKLCLYAYISMAIFQHIILSTDKNAEQVISAKINADYVKELINHCLLSKEEAEEVIQLIDKYF